MTSYEPATEKRSKHRFHLLVSLCTSKTISDSRDTYAKQQHISYSTNHELQIKDMGKQQKTPYIYTIYIYNIYIYNIYIQYLYIYIYKYNNYIRLYI